VELPAGGGKTRLLVDAVREINENGGKALVLTHTHAGVHSIRHKMRAFGVAASAAHVGTLTSLSFELVRSYSQIAGVEVPAAPDWEDSTRYTEAACRVLQNRHVREVFGITYSHMLIDEYQDCSMAQHTLALELARAIPAAAVFGDRLQGIFGFRDPIVDWVTDVLPRFPAIDIEFVPRRWVDHNQALGEWLYEMRDRLRPGVQVAFDTNLPQGVRFVGATPQRFEIRNAALQERPEGESVVVIAPPDTSSARSIAGLLGGAYGVMEDVGGRFMIQALTELERAEPLHCGLWLAQLAKQCFVGFSEVNQTVLNRLAKGKHVAGLHRPGLERTLAAFDRVLDDPTYEVLAASMLEIRAAREARLHSRECWNDIAMALDRCGTDPDRLPTSEISKIRDRLRHAGRPTQLRVISRTALIKGLEYDHVIVANVDRITDHCNLYVALSRARKSVTIVGRSASITVTETKRNPTSRAG
jgi:hypothetical protein